MKQKLKIYLKFGILLFGISIVCFTCQKDDTVFVDETTQQTEFKINLVNKFELSKNQRINNIVQSLPNKNDVLQNNTNLQAKMTYIEAYDFYVDDEIAYHITSGNYESYTFAITRAQDNGLTENLLLSKQADGSYKAAIMSYDLNESDKQSVKNGNMPMDLASKTTVSGLQRMSSGGGDSRIIFTRLDGSCYYYEVDAHSYDVVVWEIVNIDCPELPNDNSGLGGSLNNGTTNNGPNYTGPDGGTLNGPVTDPLGVLLGNTNGSNGGTTGVVPDPDNTDSGNDGGAQGETTDCLQLDASGNCANATAVLIIDEEELGRKKECRKITNLLEDTPNYKTKLVELSSDANLNSPLEKGAGKLKNQDAIEDYEAEVGFPQIEIDISGVNKFEALAHNHPTTSPFSLSTFSPQDLMHIAKLIRLNKITDNFVAFLTTKQGTQYALTISNPTKFLDLFFYKTFDPKIGIRDIPPTQQARYWASKDAFIPLYDKYFNPDIPDHKIKATDPNDPNIDTLNENDLKEFLNFMDEANIGAHLFETDATFNIFTKLKLKNGEPHRENPCN
ncbi:hypothetical protein DFQ09_1183 [Winogradskyella pacifica]|nr:hypothetical protein [Winogradskyella psychrotolerans]REE07617.1 hypothetical protein DFQ09_1183 [Winogradskyella pacifica]